MPDDVTIENNENDERDEEENCDHEDEVKLWPKIFHFLFGRLWRPDGIRNRSWP